MFAACCEGAGICLKKATLPKINVSLPCVAQDWILGNYFFHPKDRTIKGIKQKRSAVPSASETSLLFTAAGIPGWV